MKYSVKLIIKYTVETGEIFFEESILMLEAESFDDAYLKAEQWVIDNDASLLIGINDYWGKLAWFAVPVMGLGLMLTEFFTFEAANHMTFGNTNYPDPYLLLVGAAISALGLGVGKGISVLKRRKKEK